MKKLFKKIIIAILSWEARVILKKYKPSIIAVTGSVGKTSTKDAIYTVLSPTCHMRKSEKSFNSEFGVPLTILGVETGWNDPVIWLENIFHGLELILFKSEYPECLVVEVGADHPGDIQSVTQWLKPDVAVITRVSDIPVHVEFFPSADALAEEKAYLAKALKKGGALILSADNERVREMGKLATGDQKVLTFGITFPATISASQVELNFPTGMSFKLNYEGNSIPVQLKGVIGNQHVYPIVAAVAVGLARGVSISKLVETIGNHVPPRGRMNLIEGIKGSTIIDDTYNSSPDAVEEALGALSKLQTKGKKIAVLGDMLELGKFSGDEHKKAGVLAMKSCDVLVTVGPRSKLMSEHAITFDTALEAGEYVKSIVGEGDAVLVKGSQSMRMERVVKALLLDPSQAPALLVRQEKEWLARV
ncbi:MAG: UDP-N-acetylmuramoyl-tripeptide--D-alanyl-D-alanine ligase [Patescibacteria group bacterium]